MCCMRAEQGSGMHVLYACRAGKWNACVVCVQSREVECMCYMRAGHGSGMHVLYVCRAGKQNACVVCVQSREVEVLYALV